jgi:hypothetical protein
MLRRFLDRIGFTLLLLAGIAALPQAAFAHCDTVDGPVVTAAKLALERGDAAPVLMWVKKEHEPQIREALSRALEVRQQGESARALADQFFFETVVRLHRAGEGAPYTGLKAAGEGVEPLVLVADRALETGKAEQLAERVAHQVEAGLHQRLQRTLEARVKSSESVEAGREFVAAYVELMHYLERLGAITAGPGEAPEHSAAVPKQATH